MSSHLFRNWQPCAVSTSSTNLEDSNLRSVWNNYQGREGHMIIWTRTKVEHEPILVDLKGSKKEGGTACKSREKESSCELEFNFPNFSRTLILFHTKYFPRCYSHTCRTPGSVFQEWLILAIVPTSWSHRSRASLSRFSHKKTGVSNPVGSSARGQPLGALSVPQPPTGHEPRAGRFCPSRLSSAGD